MPLPNWVNWGILFDQFFTSKVQPKPIRRATVLHLQAMELVTSFHLQDGIRVLGGRDVCYVYILIYPYMLQRFSRLWVSPIFTASSPILSISVTILLLYQYTLCWSKVCCCCSSLYRYISRCAGLVVRDGCCTPGTAEFRDGCLFRCDYDWVCMVVWLSRRLHM